MALQWIIGSDAVILEVDKTSKLMHLPYFHLPKWALQTCQLIYILYQIYNY